MAVHQPGRLRVVEVAAEGIAARTDCRCRRNEPPEDDERERGPDHAADHEPAPVAGCGHRTFDAVIIRCQPIARPIARRIPSGVLVVSGPKPYVNG